MVLIKFMLIAVIYDFFLEIDAQTICKKNPNYCGPYGECVIKNGLIACECKKGYIGPKCNLYDPCNEKRRCYPNGYCVSKYDPGAVGHAKYYCQCNTGYYGEDCLEEIDSNPCSSQPCFNDGICVNKNVTHFGLPKWDYTYIKGLCRENRCLNDGLCIPYDDGYNCSCKAGYFGQYCENEINECAVQINGILTSPCLNNGICYDLIDGFFCECVGPYHGETCENYLNPCVSNPCGEASICRAIENSYTCACSPGLFGRKCQKDPCLSNPCKQKSSICIPIEENGLQLSTESCSCENQNVSYVCICQVFGQSFINSSC